MRSSSALSACDRGISDSFSYGGMAASEDVTVDFCHCLVWPVLPSSCGLLYLEGVKIKCFYAK